MLLHIGELQRITYLAHFDKDKEAGNPRKGWAEVLLLRDLAKLIPEPGQIRSEALFDVWGENWSGLGGDDDQAVVLRQGRDGASADRDDGDPRGGVVRARRGRGRPVFQGADR